MICDTLLLNSMLENINLENISESIFLIRSEKVMIDFDLALLYGIETRILKQQVRRNSERFPEDFMFELNKEEWKELITNCDKFKKYKNSPSRPFAFTEQGVAMLSSVLNSKRAIDVNISIMRTFTQIRKMTLKNDELVRKLEQLEKNSNLKFLQYDEQFRVIMELIQQMNIEDEEENTRKIGFKTD